MNATTKQARVAHYRYYETNSKGFFVVSVRSGHGSYKMCTDHPPIPTHHKLTNTEVLIMIEKDLNGGLLSHEAEIQYPLQGKHDEPIYKATHCSFRHAKQLGIV